MKVDRHEVNKSDIDLSSQGELETLLDHSEFDFADEDRQRIELVLSGESDEGAEDALEWVKKGDALNELQEVDSKGFKIGSISRARKLVKLINSETIILQELGQDWVRRYLNALQGSGFGHPYFFPNPISDEQLGVYLDFDCGDVDYRRQCVVDLITQPLNGEPYENLCDLNFGYNLILSLLKHDLDFFIHMNKCITGLEMITFLKRVNSDIANSKVRQSFSHLFDEKRWRLIGKYVAESKKCKRMMAQKTFKKIKKHDRLFFDQLHFVR